MKKAAVFFADGFEEVEALTQVDLLRRAGIETVMVSIHDRAVVKGAHGIEINTDSLFDQKVLRDFDAVILPGGMPGTTGLENCMELKSLILDFNKSGRLIAAICAAPMVLGKLGILKGKKACSYPGFEKYLDGAEVIYQNVVKDGNIITSRGVGTAIDFAYTIIASLESESSAQEVIESIVYES